MPRHRIRLDKAPRPCWFAEWLDQDDTIPGINYNEGRAWQFGTVAEAQAVAARLGGWVPTVEEVG